MPTIFGVPTTLFSSAFGAIMGFVMRMNAQKAELEAAKHKHTIEAMAAQSENYARHVDSEVRLLEARTKFEEKLLKADPQRSIARKNIAYGITGGIIFFLPIFLWQSGIEWIWATDSVQKEGWWLWQKSKEVVNLQTQAGLPITWLFVVTDVFAGLASFYFSGSLAKFNNPYAK